MADIVAFLSTTDFALAVGITLLGGLVHGITGFGGALVTMPLLAVLFGPVEAIALSAPSWVLGTAQMFPRASRQADWSAMWPILIPAAISTPIGALFLFILDPDIVRRVIGVLVLGAALVLSVGWVYRGRRGLLPGIIAGSLAGSITGFAGVGGPPAVVYIMAWPDPPAMQRANIVLAAGLVAFVTLISIAIGGAYDFRIAVMALILAPLYAAGTWLGGAIFRAAPEKFFRRAALTILFASGISAIFL